MSKKSSSNSSKPIDETLLPPKPEEGSKIIFEDVVTGNAGELHQTASDLNTATLTNQLGTPIADNQNSLKIGDRGPVALEDFHVREKIFHFDHERIPERVVHARGYGAHGFFETYESLKDITKADIFQRKGEKTPIFVRFSTVAGNKGSSDLVRDVRGFAVKFYTQQGNWDLVGNNIPVFFIQDGIKFPDLVHALKPAPDREFPQAQTAHDNFWDFISLTPESMNMVMWIMSDRTIPRSFRFMEGFGVHTFRLINATGKSMFVKFHWKPKLGLQSVMWNEAVKINGADPDFHRRDLWNAIQQGNFPEWELGMQLFDDEFANSFDFDILDPTKLIPEEIIPIRKVGRMVLNKTVDNFFAETEQVAFGTHNLIPGIDFSNDPLLQIRNFSYLDTQLKRLGSTNFTQLPINAPKCPVSHFQQDGHMAFQNPKGRVNYEPNSWGAEIAGPRENPEIGFTPFKEQIEGTKQRQRPESFADHYSQARQFFISQIPIEQEHIIDALIFELSKVERLDIRERMVSHLMNIDTTLAETVSKGLGFKKIPKAAQSIIETRQDLEPSEALSIILNGPKSFKGRKVGIVLTDDSDAVLLNIIIKALGEEKSCYEIVAPVVGGVTLNDGSFIEAQQKINGAPSVLYDAVILLLSKTGAKKLAQESTAKDFVCDAMSHLKFIGYTEDTAILFEEAGIASKLDEGCVLMNNEIDVTQFIKNCRKLRFWSREAKVKMPKE